MKINRAYHISLFHFSVVYVPYIVNYTDFLVRKLQTVSW